MSIRKSSNFYIDILACSLSSLIYLISYFIFNFYSERIAISMVLASVAILDVAILNHTLRAIKRHIVLFIFTVSFNILILGRTFITWVRFPENLYIVADTDNGYHLYLALSIIFLSLATVFTVYRLFSLVFKKQEQKIQLPTTHKSDVLIPYVSVLSRIALYISFVAQTYTLSVIALSVYQNGYMSSYVSRPEIPYFITLTASFFFPSFVLFLATKPAKKQLVIPVILYCIVAVVSIFTGRRNLVVRDVLLLLIYVVMRDDCLSGPKKIITKLKLLIGVAGGTVGVYLLQVMRTGFKSSLFDALLKFVYAQGASFSIVIKTVMHNNIFTECRINYLLYPLYYQFNNSFLASWIFGAVPIVENQTLQFVKTTLSYPHILTYFVEPQRYLSGGGFGASYIADGYILCGVLGVILVSIMVGALIRFLPSLLTRSFIVIAFGLNIARYMVYIPRNFSLGWIVEAFSLTTLIFYAAICGAAYLLNRFKPYSLAKLSRK